MSYINKTALPAPAPAADACLPEVEELDEADGQRGARRLQLPLQVARPNWHLPVFTVPAELTINNNAKLQQNQSLLSPQRRRATATRSCRAPPQPMSPPRTHQEAREAALTFAKYLRSHKEPGPPPLLVSSRSNAAENGPGQRMSDSGCVNDQPSIFKRPQLNTFAEFLKRAQQEAAVASSSSQASKYAGADEPRVHAVSTNPVEMDVTAMASETVVMGDENEEDAESAETRNKGGCCSCFSRNRKDLQDTANRRKRRVVAPRISASFKTNRIASITLEDDPELADMDPTTTLMPYVLFESERAKVLYQSSSIEEVELLKRAINLHANDMYKKVLMRLHMHRYLHLFKEAVVRSLLSQKVQLGHDSALAANFLGIDISEEFKTASGASSSAALAVGATLNAQLVEMLNSPSRTSSVGQPSDVSRDMFNPAPKITDAEILELFNSGKIIDVTGRASLESLVSLPTAKVGQRRNSWRPIDEF